MVRDIHIVRGTVDFASHSIELDQLPCGTKSYVSKHLRKTSVLDA